MEEKQQISNEIQENSEKYTVEHPFMPKKTKAEIKSEMFKFFMENKIKELGKDFNRKLIRRQIREHLHRNGEKKKYPFNGIASRKERRERNKYLGIPFNPVYNGPVLTYKEAYGIGYERFNNKFAILDGGENSAQEG